jgi:hypothetical protein
MSTWDEFTGDQLRMQGVEAMQKQLLIREKKRAAARLEKKASEFEDKKKAILEMNLAIEERRQAARACRRPHLDGARVAS